MSSRARGDSPRTRIDDRDPLDALERACSPVLCCGTSDGAWARTIRLAQAAAARRLGPVGVWAERAPSPAEIALAAGAQVRELGLALHGARREVHDWHAREGAFDEALAAISVARAHGLACAVGTVVTRSNARVLTELPSLLKSAGVALWALVWPAAGQDFTARVPRFGLAVPSALAAVERARQLGLEARILGAPACALGPFAPLALPSWPRAYASRCEVCAARRGCPGVDRRYLARFGEGELRSIPRPRVAPPPPLAQLVTAALSE